MASFYATGPVTLKIDGQEIPLANFPIIVEDTPPRPADKVDLTKGVTYTIAVDYAQPEPPPATPPIP